jgi:protein-serine/threonine kinase
MAPCIPWNTKQAANMDASSTPKVASKICIEKSTGAKLKLERYYENFKQQAVERETRKCEFEDKIKMMPASDLKRMADSFSDKENEYLRFRRVKMHVNDFQTIKVIGKGAFGEVRLVQKRDSGRIYAMKTMKKTEMIKNDQVNLFNFSWLMSKRNEIYWRNQRVPGWLSFIIPSKMRSIST